MTEKLDRRVRRTQERLRQALIKKLETKSLNDITVVELAEEADINRGTFYLHSRDVYDLYQKMEDDVLLQLQGMIEAHVTKHATGRLLPVISEAFSFLWENSKTCIAIMRTNGKSFMERLVAQCKPKNAKEWYAFIGDEKDREYYYAFVTTGCIGLIQRWLDSGMKETPQEMSRLAETIMDRCLGRTASK